MSQTQLDKDSMMACSITVGVGSRRPTDRLRQIQTIAYLVIAWRRSDVSGQQVTTTLEARAVRDINRDAK